jgi:hypothetical protein
MDKKLEQKLVEKYPTLYSKYGGDIKKTCMGWGMECDNGWFNLLDELSAQLEPLNIVAEQIKEKFGGLVFYIEPCSEDIYDTAMNIINNAQSKSYTICETCGNPGKLRRNGWMRTSCDECQKEYEESQS